MLSAIVSSLHASFGVVREPRERLAPLSAEARRNGLGENALCFDKLAA